MVFMVVVTQRSKNLNNFTCLSYMYQFIGVSFVCV